MCPAGHSRPPPGSTFRGFPTAGEEEFWTKLDANLFFQEAIDHGFFCCITLDELCIRGDPTRLGEQLRRRILVE
jgi:hypothetical protein